MFVSVHETSADNATAELVTALSDALAGPVTAAGLAGPRCAAAGVELWREATRDALHGIVEVVGKIPAVLRDIRDTARRVARFAPDVCVLVDAPDYNIRLAKQIRRLRPDVPIVYFLCPQIWAWRTGRVRLLRTYFDERLCIVPFEPAWYRQYYTHAYYVGHPAVERVAAYRDDALRQAQAAGHATRRAWLRARYGIADEEPVVAVLPGSRGREIRGVLPVQLDAVSAWNARRRAAGLPSVRPVVSAAPLREAADYEAALARAAELRPLLLHPTLDSDAAAPKGVAPGTSFDAATLADFAAVCSGTASLETALLGCPQVVCYRLHPVTAWIARLMVRVPYASLVNLVLGREAVRECLQERFTVKNVAGALADLAEDSTRRRVEADYAEMAARFGPPGAAERAAARIAQAVRRGGRAEAEDPFADWIRADAPLRSRGADRRVRSFGG